MGDITPTGWALGVALVTIAVAMIAVRRPRRGERVSMVPWNFILITAIMVAALALASLLGVKGRY